MFLFISPALDIINILMVVIFSQILRFTTLMKSFQWPAKSDLISLI